MVKYNLKKFQIIQKKEGKGEQRNNKQRCQREIKLENRTKSKHNNNHWANDLNTSIKIKAVNYILNLFEI